MICAALTASLLLATPALADVRSPASAQISVCFAPAQSCTPEIVAAIRSARRMIRVQAYGFTSPPILSALIAAAFRGVDVKVIVEKSNDRASAKASRYSGATSMANAGVPVWIDDQLAIAHNKLIIIDGQLVVGGSFNYTASADKRNAENLTSTESTMVTHWFLDDRSSRQAISRALGGSEVDDSDRTGSLSGEEQ